MAGIFGGGGSKAPPPAPVPVPVPKKDDSDIQRQAAEEARRRRLAMGRNSTILSRGADAANDDSAPATRKSLLGS